MSFVNFLENTRPVCVDCVPAILDMFKGEKNETAGLNYSMLQKIPRDKYAQMWKTMRRDW